MTKKTNIVILVSGVIACVVLSFMMTHLLSMKVEDKAIGRVVQRFKIRFSSILAREPRFRVRGLENTTGASASLDVLVKVEPKPTADVEAMITQMGDFLWLGRYRRGRVARVRIEITDPIDKTKRTVEVPNRRVHGARGSNRVPVPRYRPLPRPKPKR